MIKFDADSITISMLDDIDLRPGMRVLDVGCGYGSVSRMIAERVGPNGRVTAMDREMSHLAQAEELTIESGLRNIDYVHGDLTSIELASESYDAIVGRRVLMYLPDAKLVLQRLIGALRAGSAMAFQEHVEFVNSVQPGDWPLHDQVRNWIWETVRREGGNPRLGYSLQKWILESGLQPVAVQAHSIIAGHEHGQHPFDVTASYMVNRIVAASIASVDQIRPETLVERLMAERANNESVYVSELAFVVNARK